MVDIKLENLNFKKKKTGDCVTKALMVVTGLEYQEVAKLQFETWMKTGFHTTDKKNYSKILEDQGFIKHKMPKKINDDGAVKRYRVGEINELVQSNEIAFIDLAGHSVPYKNGILIDSWDCRKKSISNYWTKEADFEISLDEINSVIQRIKL